MQTVVTDDDQTVYVATDESERGSKGPFFVVYTDDTHETRWGFRCGNCETLNNAMDTMGR
ncbi:MAG: DUF5816 domain-containing protein, partial [Halobacteriales archaeon]